MSDRVDRILGILDVGMQTSREHGYGDDFARTACSRCQDAAPEPNGDLCGGCRAYLLGDSDFDPNRPIRGYRSDFEIIDECYQHGDYEFPLLRRPEPIRVDTSEGLLCFGGPMEGRLVASPDHHLRAVIPTPLSYALAATDPMALSCETVTYERREVGWRGDDDQLFLASCWVLTDDNGQQVIDTLNMIAAWAGIAQ